MKNLEQPNLENLENIGGIENEELFDNSNKDIVEKFNRSNEDVNEITSNDGSQKNFGKFKDLESLLKAYNSLQSEFTKKSQRLSELEGEIKPFEKQDKINASVEDVINKYSNCEPFKQKLKDNLQLIDTDDYSKLAEENLLKLLVENFKSPDELIEDENFLSNYIFNNEKIKELVVQEYLNKLKSAPNVKVATSFNSSIPATPPNVVRTIKEAGNIAKSIIKNI